VCGKSKYEFLLEKQPGPAAMYAAGPCCSVVEGRIDEVDVFFAQAVLGQPQTFANTINMK